MNGVENFIIFSKFSTPFHVVARCAQNWTFVKNLAPKNLPLRALIHPPPFLCNRFRQT